MQVLAAYDRVLQRRPILVKTLTSATLFGLGDLMSQKLEGAVRPRSLEGATSRGGDNLRLPYSRLCVCPACSRSPSPRRPRLTPAASRAWSPGEGRSPRWRTCGEDKARDLELSYALATLLSC
jgi:hypothetical protein